jgi:hypothetical protein
MAAGPGRPRLDGPAVHRCIAAIAAALAAAAIAAAPARAQGTWDTSNQHQMVPAYLYPDWWNAGNGWYRICDAMNVSGGPSTAIMNPASGPGTAANADYQRVIDYCHARGQRVIAYVHSSYGGRALADVMADVDASYRFYPAIDGIFVDEMSNDPATLAYYQLLRAHVQAKPGPHLVVGNPGIDAETGWQLDRWAVDELVIFEGTAESYMRWSPPAWAFAHPASRLSNLVHAAGDATTLAQVCARSKSQNAGYMYVTDDILPNPWDTLPAEPYWSSEIAAC